MEPIHDRQGYIAPPPPQIADPILEIAGKILFAIGIIFATTPIWSYFAAIAIPNPLIIAIGGIAFCILGIRILINNVAPPQQAPHLDPETPLDTPRENVQSASNLAQLTAPEKAPFQHEREMRIIEKNVSSRLITTQQQAQEQMQQECVFGLLAREPRDWTSPLTADSVSQVIKADSVSQVKISIGIATATNSTFFNESYLCKKISFKNSLSNKSHQDTTAKTFEGSVLAILSGRKEAPPFVAKHLIPTLTSHLEKHRLSETGIFNSLKLTFAQLDAFCYTQKVKGSTSLLVVLFLGKRIWVANIEHSRAFFVSNDFLAQVQQMEAAQELAQVQQMEAAQEPPHKEDAQGDDPKDLAARVKILNEEEELNTSLLSVADEEAHQIDKATPFPIALSMATDLSNPVFKKSAEKRGGNVEEVPVLSTTKLVVGKLNHARIIGGHDKGSKHIGARPKITSLTLDKEGYLVIGSEGFSSIYLPSCLVVKHLSENSNKTEANIAQELVSIVQETGSFLNITVMVVKITSEILETARGET